MDRDHILSDWLLFWEAAERTGRSIVLEAFAHEHSEFLPDFLRVIRSLEVFESPSRSRFRLW